MHFAGNDAGASGRDKDQRSLNEAPSTREVLETSGDIFSSEKGHRSAQEDAGRVWITTQISVPLRKLDNRLDEQGDAGDSVRVEAGAGEKLYFKVKGLITDWTMDLITVDHGQQDGRRRHAPCDSTTGSHDTERVQKYRRTAVCTAAKAARTKERQESVEL